MHSATLRHVLTPALSAAAGADSDAAAEAVDALARLEASAPGACLSFVAQVMTAAVAAPIAGGGELEQLRQLATKLGECVAIGMMLAALLRLATMCPSACVGPPLQTVWRLRLCSH
jgi:hypothetical protein